MAVEESIKSKIDLNYPSESSPNFSNKEYGYILEGGALVGNAPFQEGDRPDDPRTPYQTAFRELSIIQFKDKQYKNLFYNEIRYALRIFNEGSDELNKVINNIRTTDLGVLFEEFGFSQFDVDVSIGINNKIKRGGSISLDKLPTLETYGPIDQTTGLQTYTSNIPFAYQGSIVGTFGGFNLKPDVYQELLTSYFSENGSNLEQQTGDIGLDSSLEIKGNVSEITNDFIYSDQRTTGIIAVFSSVDTTNASSILNTYYKDFLVQTLKLESASTFKGIYDASVEGAITDILFYLTYDFEFNRREQLVNQLDQRGGDVSLDEIDDILDAAEAAALDDLAASGLVGEGGVTLQQEAVNPEDAQRFYEQCVLLAKMNDLKKYFNNTIKEEFLNTDGEDDGKEIMHQPLPYQGRFYMVDAPEGKNQRLLNFISSPRGKKANDFLSITPDIQAFLTPKLRLFKVFNLEGEDVQQVEFIFKNTTSANTKLRRLFQDDSKFFRGSGYGIKNFSFSFNGTTPATAKNDITAELTLFFQDFSDFVTEFQTTEGTFKFVDLIFYDKKNKNNPTYGYGSTHPDQYSPSYYRIRADVGWNVPEDNPQFDDACRKRGLDPDNIRDVIEKTNRSYYLNMVEHDLNFKKDGTVEIKAQYRGYVESVLKGTDMDALVDGQVLANRASRANTMKTALRDCTPGEVARIKRIYAAEELRTIKETRKRFYERLRELGKIHTYQVIDDGGFKTSGYFERRPNGYVELGSNELNKNQFNFYYLGDLLYVMLDTMYENSNVSPNIKNKFIIPSIDFEAFFEKSENFSINIAQIPIADRYFEEWWTENVIKEDRRSFPIMFFLRKLLNDLVANALIDVCLNRDYERSFNFQTTTLNAANDPLETPAGVKPANGTSFDPVIQLSTDIVPFSVPEGTKIKDIMNYVVVYPAYSTTLPIGAGDYTEDLENAVYHFNLGQDRGIVNEVKFSKVDMQYIREARYKREGIDGLLQLGAVYTANLQMFGNTLFYPGMQIFINPFGIGGEEFIPNKTTSIANKLGLGGYHLITKVNSSIASGLFKTTVDAQFIYSGDGDSRKIKQGENEPKDEESVETPTTTEQTCARLVKAVEDDYTNLVATGQISNTAAAVAEDIERQVSGSPLVNPTFQNSQVVEEVDADNDGIPDALDLTPNGETE